MSEKAHKTDYEELLPHAVTAFYLPDSPVVTADFYPYYLDKEKSSAFVGLSKQLPFPCVRLIKTVHAQDETGVHHYYCDTVFLCENDSWVWASKIIARFSDGRRLTIYFPETAKKLFPESTYRYDSVRQSNIPVQYAELIETLESPKIGYIERGVSRQVRRSENLNTDYREYIVINRREAARQSYLTVGQVFRRHPQLHAVRGHLRHYRSGKIAYVQPHTRGVGEMLQVKDYIIKEGTSP